MTPSTPGVGPLAGVRVLDLSRVLAGPFCSMILADLGAEVLKIEELVKGDQTRTIPPFINGESHYFLAINRNKKSLAVDTRRPEGREIILDLVRHSDVVLENFRTGVMERLGLSAETLMAIKPNLVICSISGFGKGTHLSDKPSFDLITQAMSGVMSINGEPDGPPTKLGIPMGDVGGGLWSAIGVLAGLQHRNATGKGIRIDYSLLDGMIGLLGYLAEIYLVTGESPARMGSSHHSVVPYGRFPVKDGHIVIALHVGNFWRKFCGALGREDLAENPRYRTTADRQKHRDELEALITAILLTKTADEWHEILDRADVPHGTVNSVRQALEQRVVQERGLLKETWHPIAGAVRVVGNPLQFDLFGDTPYAAAPVLGAHTEPVLAELLGYDAARIAQLEQAGVIALGGEGRPRPTAPDKD
jgi:crotonobetainyl-CoA:carnitine CoA-transferase CaiB-like acyl-CoA transferase